MTHRVTGSGSLQEARKTKSRMKDKGNRRMISIYVRNSLKDRRAPSRPSFLTIYLPIAIPSDS